ncbi:MAG: hypothetical protein AABY15_06775 [Nanoarchaeota archaeon]
MTNNKKAVAQLQGIDIDAHEENDTVYVRVGDVSLELASFEIDFRAKLYDEEKEGK